MVDLLPIQLAAHEWKVGEVEWMYAPNDHFNEWYARCDSIAATLGGEGFGNPYFYPPFVAATLAPVSDVHALIWRDVLFGINVLLIFVYALLVLRICRVAVTRRAFLWGVALALLSYSMSRTTKLGQIVPLLAALTWFGLLWLREHKFWRAGLMLGLISAVKLFPFGFIVLPLVGRRIKVAAIWIGTVVVIYASSLVLLGITVHQYFWKAATQFGTLIYPYQGNQSLIGWYARLFRRKALIDIVPFSDPGIETAKWIITAVVMGLTVFWMWRYRQRLNDQSFPAFAGVLIAGIILSLSTSWDHYWLFELPVLGWAINEEWTRDESRFRLGWILGASFLFLMKLTRFYVDTPLGRVITGSQTMGMVMLWLWLFWWIREKAKIARPDVASST